MCKHGSTVLVETLRGPANVDSCIADIVAALNKSGMRTHASCCGHGQLPGWISLSDGRELRIMSFEQAQGIDALIGRTIHGESTNA
jgi:hypothetical protein